VVQRRFAASPAATGMRIVFEGKPYTVVGVTPTGFRLFGGEPDALIPLGQSTERIMQRRDAHPGINV
jgi:hypothetical protein